MKEDKETIRGKIREYFEDMIQSKKNMRKRIYQLENKIEECKENEKYAIQQMEIYKSKYRELKRASNLLIKGGEINGEKNKNTKK